MTKDNKPIVTDEMVTHALQAYRAYPAKKLAGGRMASALKAALEVQPKPELAEKESNLVAHCRDVLGDPARVTVSRRDVTELLAIIDRLTGRST